MTFVVGLTGGIGSGKSTVADLFAKKNITIIDTDQLSRSITLPNTDVLHTIQQYFGSVVISNDGSLNRKALRDIIFKDNLKRLWLEQLLHPLIREKIKHQVNRSASPYCIVVIPLLFETEHNPIINRILTIDVPVEDQIKRTRARDNINDEVINAILKTQVTREIREQKAHDIIYNHGTIEELKPQVEKLHQLYLTLSNKF